MTLSKTTEEIEERKKWLFEMFVSIQPAHKSLRQAKLIDVQNYASKRWSPTEETKKELKAKLLAEVFPNRLNTFELIRLKKTLNIIDEVLR